VSNDWDGLVEELRSLRQRRGLTLQALAKCPQLLSALNNPPLQEAHDALLKLVEQLGDDEPGRALKHAYAIGLSDPRTLTDRRADLKARLGRDPKTLASYENKMIAEVASRILGTRKAEVSDSEVYVVGTIEKFRLVRVSVTVRFPPDETGNAFERTVDYENRSAAQSLPALLYQLPHDWQPKSLVLGLNVDQASAQADFWTTAGNELLQLMFADIGQPAPLTDGVVMVRMDGPKNGVIYAVYWLA
jgi:transcriptional regulator with XRE-family HTH domain